jgi:hypothetical protein
MVIICHRLIPFRWPACSFAVGFLTIPPRNCNVCAVTSASARRPPQAAPASDLRAAFGQYAKAVGWPWTIRISALRPQDTGGLKTAPAAVRIDLSLEDARVLAGLLRDAADPDDDAGPRGPIERWIGTAEAAARIDVEASTIRGWISRNGPKAHPFPRPEVSHRGRSYWQKATVDKWKTDQRRLEEGYRASSGRPRSR